VTRCLIPLALLLLATPAAAADLDVLFVGNSYTAANDLATTVEGMIEAQGTLPDTRTEAHSPGGRRLVEHLADADGTNGATPLNQWMTADPDRWHVIVLQEQSQIPGFYDLAPDYDESLDSAVGLDDLVAAAGADTLFFMTWGRRSG